MKIEMLFGVVAALVIVFAAAVFATQYVAPEATVEEVSAEQTTETVSTTMYTITEIVEYDSEAEMQYLYVQSQNIRGNFEELNEIQERMYDVAEDYDPVEYDMLQEQVDNERTIAKYVRDIVELPT